MEIGPLLTGAAAVSALAYSLSKEGREATFDLRADTAGAGANSWPERWPEDWLEKDDEATVHGVWRTHTPDYRLKQKLPLARKAPDADEFAPGGTSAIQSCFPFHIVWDVMKLDLEKADARLADQRVAMERELTDLALRRQKAQSVYLESAANAEAAPNLRDIRHRRHERDGNETGSLSDPEEATDALWQETQRQFDREQQEIVKKYRAAAAGYNVTADKATRQYPKLFWMRNVRLIPVTKIGPARAHTRHKVKVNAKIKVAGGKVHDDQHGFVDIELEWTETHKFLGTYNWLEWIRIDATGQLLDGSKKWRDRFDPSKIKDGSSTAQMLTAQGRRRLQAVEKAHREQGVFAQIPGVQPRITADLTRPPPAPPVPEFLIDAKTDDLIAPPSASSSKPNTPRPSSLGVPSPIGRSRSLGDDVRRTAERAAQKHHQRRTSHTRREDQFIAALHSLPAHSSAPVTVEHRDGRWQVELHPKNTLPGSHARIERSQGDEKRYVVRDSRHLTTQQRAALTALFKLKRVGLDWDEG